MPGYCDARGGPVAGQPADYVLQAMNWIRRLWVRATYWPVLCDVCKGTGVCQKEHSKGPHSCCGGCERIVVPAWQVKKSFPAPGGSAIIGNGVMYRRPWSSKQVARP